jgi:hypothetical protein
MAWIGVAATTGFVIACYCNMRFFPELRPPHVVREKMVHLSKYGDDYDAIFLGSSRIQNHVMPAIFDRVMTERGHPMRSFNFGISSLHAPEDDYVLDLILAEPHARLRWVFVEIDFFRTDLQADQTGTFRGLYWHDLPRFALLCRRLSVATEIGIRRNIRDALGRGEDFLQHGRLFCERSANVGRGSELLERRFFRTPPAPMDWESLGPLRDGWVAATPGAKDIAERVSGHLGSFLKERIVNPPVRDEADSASQSILASLLMKIVKAGAMPVIVIPPRIRQYYFYPSPALARRFPIIDLCDPVKYPVLYREETRVDRSHFNKEGAEIFTRLMAETFDNRVRKNFSFESEVRSCAN